MNEQGETGPRNLLKDFLVPAVSRRAQKGSTRTRGKQEDEGTQVVSGNREDRQGAVNTKLKSLQIFFGEI